MEETPVILTNSLDTNRGGVTKSVITRANMLADYYNDVYIYTFLYQQRFKSIIDKLKSNNELDSRVKIVNMFDDLKPQKKFKLIRNVNKEKNKGLLRIKDKKQSVPAYRYYKNGIYVKYERYDHDSQINFVDIMNDSRHRIAREEYNDTGQIVRKRHYDLKLNKPSLDRYYDENGDVYLSIWIDSEKDVEYRTLLINGEAKEFKSIEGLKKQWLQEKVNQINKPILIVDHRQLYDTVLKTKNCNRVFVVHNNHLKSPYVDINKMKEVFPDLFSNFNQDDQIIFLTETQKNDVESVYGSFDNFNVIPHAVNESNKHHLDKNVQYDPKKVVTIARLESQKRIDESIRAFRKVVDEIPDAIFKIFGKGKLEKELLNLIDELNLSNNIFLYGYTEAPLEEYQKAACSILTSDFEGFGLVVTESLSVGTPVVSYNTNYGPGDIIRNGIDGALVEQGDKDALAREVIDIMTNDEKRQTLSNNATEVYERYSYQKFINNWVHVINGFNQ